MSQRTRQRSGLVRVTVASGSRRVDLVLPGAVPVAELRARARPQRRPARRRHRLRRLPAGHPGRPPARRRRRPDHAGRRGRRPAHRRRRRRRRAAPRLRRRRRGDGRRRRARPEALGAGRRTAYRPGRRRLLLGLGAFALLLQGERLLAAAAAAVVVAGCWSSARIVLSRAQRRARGRGRRRLDGRGRTPPWPACCSRPDGDRSSALPVRRRRRRGAMRGRRWWRWSVSARAAPWSSRRSWSARSSPPPAW